MKKATLFSTLLLFLTGFYACSGWTDPVDFDFDDPQRIRWVEDVVDDSLLVLLGEEDIHFGHTPPNLDTISFVVDQFWYDTCIRVKKITLFINGNPFDSMLTSYNNLGFEKTTYKHHFYNPRGNIISQTMYLEDNQGNRSLFTCDSTYIIGSGNDFTAYYKWTSESQQEGYPTWGFLVSGTLEYTFDTLHLNDSVFELKKRFVGVKNYRIGKMIEKIGTPPTQGYYPGTRMFLRPYDKDITGKPAAYYMNWDTLTH